MVARGHIIPGRVPSSKPRSRRFAGGLPSAPGRTRTCDPRLRRPSLYPSELRGPGDNVVGRLRTLRLTAAVSLVGAVIVLSLVMAHAAEPAAAAGVRAGQTARPAAGRCRVPGFTKSLDALWHPNMRAAIAYARTRMGDIAFAVRTDHRYYGYRPDHVEWSASVVKAMLMVAYLDEPSVARRKLDSADHALLGPMITESDNNAATEVRAIVGNGALQALAGRVGMPALRHRGDLGRDADHRRRPDQVLPPHRALHRLAPSRVRHAPPGQHRALRALGRG